METKKEKIIRNIRQAAPKLKPEAILQAWLPFKDQIGVTSITTEDDYEQVCTIVNELLDEIGNDEQHPLAEVLYYLADQMQAYEAAHCTLPEAEPKEILHFLMEQHGLKQKDLTDCASQSRISEILNGKRPMSKEMAKRFARRFNVHADVFL